MIPNKDFRNIEAYYVAIKISDGLKRLFQEETCTFSHVILLVLSPKFGKKILEGCLKLCLRMLSILASNKIRFLEFKSFAMQFAIIFGTSNDQRTFFYPFSTIRLPTSDVAIILDGSTIALSLFAA